MPKQVVIACRVTPAKRREYKSWASDHETSVQEMLEQGLELLLRTSAETELKKGDEKSLSLAYNLSDARHRIWIDWVIEVFNSDNPNWIRGLASNVAGFLAAMAQEHEDTGGKHGEKIYTDYARAAREARNALMHLHRELPTVLRHPAKILD